MDELTGLFPEGWLDLALLICAAAFVAYSVTGLVRMALVESGQSGLRHFNSILRLTSMVTGALVGAGTADVWLHEYVVGGGLIGLASGSFSTGIVWGIKTLLRRRLNLETAKMESLEREKDDENNRA